jgi:Rrf2 family protein
MSANSRMTIAIHILSFLAAAERKSPEPVTSERIARSVATNPVVIRRMLGSLRRAGLVASRRGGHAGWTLSKSPEAITLLDVYYAVDEGPLFGLHASPPNPHCHIARGLKPALSRVYSALEEELARQLAGTTIGQVLTDTVH